MRLLIPVAFAAILIFLSAGQQRGRSASVDLRAPRKHPDYEADRQAAIRLNELAGHIHSLADARKFVDSIAAIFAHELPPEWATRSLRERIARAEYESATDPSKLVSEQRVADAWDNYVQQIGAPETLLVNEAEIHNLRDARYASSRFLWTRVDQSIWTMPNLYAVGPDGKVAHGCRAVEALQMIWELANHPETISGARERVQEGIVFSDSLNHAPGKTKSSITAGVAPGNPVKAAERRYADEYGAVALTLAVQQLISNLLPAQ